MWLKKLVTTLITWCSDHGNEYHVKHLIITKVIKFNYQRMVKRLLKAKVVTELAWKPTTDQ